MADIFLVRHGQDTDNAAGILNGRRDTDLTDLGKEQARIVAGKLKDKDIQIIYSSPLKRTSQTAAIIAKELSLKDIKLHEDLVERDFGILTGKPITDIPKYSGKILKTEKVNYFLEAEGSETFPELLDRAKRVLIELQEKHPSEQLLLVTHGDIGKMIRAAFHGWTWEEGLKTPYLDNTGVIELLPKNDLVE